MSKTCGDFGGENGQGEPCGLPAGSGTDRAKGRCEHHPKPGRPNKLTEDRKDQLLSAARNGTTKEGCARAAGIHPSTLYEWLNEFPEFSEAFSRARAQGEQRLVQEVAAENPQFLLERSYDYTKTQEIEHSGEMSHGVMVVGEQLDEDDWETDVAGD